MARDADEVNTLLDGEKWVVYVPETYDAYIKLSSCTDWDVSRQDCGAFETDKKRGYPRIVLVNKTNRLDKYLLTPSGDACFVDKRNIGFADIDDFLGREGNDELRNISEFDLIVLQKYRFKSFNDDFLSRPIYTSWISESLDIKNKYILKPILDERDFDELYRGAFGDRIRSAVEDRFFNDNYEIFKCLDSGHKAVFGLDKIKYDDNTAILTADEKEGVATASDGISYCILGQIANNIRDYTKKILHDWSMNLSEQITGTKTCGGYGIIYTDRYRTYDGTERNDLFVNKHYASKFREWLDEFIHAHGLDRYIGDELVDVASVCLHESFKEYIDTLDTKFDVNSFIIKEIARIFNNGAWADEMTFGGGDINVRLDYWYEDVKSKGI